jgi:hypothetical protein
MVRRILPAVILASALIALAFPGVGTAAPYGEGCLSAGDARAAVQSGQIVALSQILGAIRAAAGGEVLPSPQLCNMGGRLVYLVNVLSRGGAVKRLTVDAQSGAILGH